MACIQGHPPSLNEVGWAELLLDKRIGLGSNVSARRARGATGLWRENSGPIR